jgi:hypothetical protein
MNAPVLELDEEDGEDAVAEELRRLQEAANDLQLRFDKADMELKEAQLNEDRCSRGGAAVVEWVACALWCGLEEGGRGCSIG